MQQFKQKTTRDAHRGSVLVEAVVAAGITLMILMGAITAFSFLYRRAINNMAYIQAAFLGEEGLEAARILRDSGWNTNIASQTPGVGVYLYFDGATWKATSTKTFIDQTFERVVVFDNVYRDSNQNIVSSGGTLDTDIKKVTASVSWSTRGATTTRVLSMYLANVFKN